MELWFFLPCFAYMMLAVWAFAYIVTRDFEDLKKTTAHLIKEPFKLSGFSCKRAAYLSVIPVAASLPIQLWMHLRFAMNQLASTAALVFVMITLIFGFLTPKADNDRFLPFALSVFVFLLEDLSFQA